MILNRRFQRIAVWIRIGALSAFPILLLGRSTGVFWVGFRTLIGIGIASLVLLVIKKFAGDTGLKSRHLVLAGVVVALGSCWTSPTRPPDRVVARQYARSHEQLEKLIAMLLEDPRVGTIGPGFTRAVGKLTSDSPDELGIDEARLDEYRRTMRDAGVHRIDRLEDGSVLFMTWSWGGIDTFRHKGLVWRRTAPPEGPWRKYKPIGEDWYIFED